MSDEQTCGKGLAENAALTAKMGALMGSVADMLESHTAALDPADANGRLEIDAYRKLVAAHRRVRAELVALSETMESYRDLPMADHDMTALTSASAREEFENYLAAKADLTAWLNQTLEEDRSLIA